MFGVLQASKSYRQLWRRSTTRTSPLGRGAASLVLGSDATDHQAVVQAGESIVVGTTGAVNDSLIYGVRGVMRLNAAPPEGYAWQVDIVLGAYTRTLIFSESTYGASNMPLELDLSDHNLNTSGVTGAGVVTASFGLSLIQDPDNVGSAGVDVTVTLPSLYIDQLLVPETAADLYVENRLPAPAQDRVPTDFPTIQFTLADTNGAGVDLTATTVEVDGVVAYTAGAYVLPWAGTTTATDGPSGGDVTFVMTVPADNLEYESEQLVEINVVSELTGSIGAIDTTWTFVVADVIAPAMRTGAMQSKRTIRVDFTDDVLMTTAATGALNPDNYAVTVASVPASPLEVVSVAEVVGEPTMVDVTFDTDASIGANYTLLAKDLTDTSGNVVSVSGSTVPFVGYVPPRPAGRRFELLDWIPDANLEEDATVEQGGDPTNPGTGDLRRFVSVLQDVVDILLCSIDEWTTILDVDLAPEAFLDAILQDLGNPFAQCISDLSVNDKRRLARVLISIYKQKGTEPGVINAIRFFLGVEVTLDVINCRPYWQLGVSELDVSTTLAPPVGSSLWYSFYVTSPVVLTDAQRERMLCIAQYMKGAQEHVLGLIEPGDLVTPSSFWVLSQSMLGADPGANPSTILA